MLPKFASMFLANIFCNSKINFKVKKRDTRLLHPWIGIGKIHNIYRSLTDTKLHHSTNKLVAHLKFLKYLSLLVCQRQNVVLTTLG